MLRPRLSRAWCRRAREGEDYRRHDAEHTRADTETSLDVSCDLEKGVCLCHNETCISIHICAVNLIY